MIVNLATFAEIISYGITAFVVGYAIGFQFRVFIRFTENL